MKLTVAQTASFVDRWKALRLTDEDLQALEEQIGRNPMAGAVMVGTGGVRKVRFAPPSWNVGKSGATRVCYASFVAAEIVYLVTIFAKNEQANLTAADKAQARKLMAHLKQIHQRKD